jgi:hypothetical protein
MMGGGGVSCVRELCTCIRIQQAVLVGSISMRYAVCSMQYEYAV